MEITKKTKASWFGFPVLCKTKAIRDKFQTHLEKNGIETRPIICGNMTKQPGIKNIKYRISGIIKRCKRNNESMVFLGKFIME